MLGDGTLSVAGCCVRPLSYQPTDGPSRVHHDACFDAQLAALQVFFCKYNDPIYVKMEKLEIMIKLANERNIDQVRSCIKRC